MLLVRVSELMIIRVSGRPISDRKDNILTLSVNGNGVDIDSIQRWDLEVSLRTPNSSRSKRDCSR
jgi:hypothetical protein